MKQTTTNSQYKNDSQINGSQINGSQINGSNNETSLKYSENFKKGVNLFSNFFLALLIIAISFICYAQDKTCERPGTQINYSASNGDANYPGLTQNQPAVTTRPDIEAVSTKLREARDNEDMVKVRQLEAELNSLTGSTPSQFINNPAVTGMQQTVQYYTEGGDGISTIANGPYWAIATQTSNRSNKIYAAVTEYVGADPSDQLKIYVSYDNGINWVLKGVYNGFSAGARFRSEELDIEPIISGSDTLVYAVAGYTYNNNAYSFIGRFNVATGQVNAQSFSLSLGTTMNYNPRIVSDNSNYTSATYMYITVSNDTAVTSNNHAVRTRLCVIQNPWDASFTQAHRNPSSSHSFWWIQTSAPSNSYSYQDVGYFRNGPDNTDVIYVATIYRGTTTNNYVYTAWSKNYGATNAGNLVLTESTPVSKVRLAFNGAVNQNGAMIYLKDYTTNPLGDVDVRVQNTTTGGFFTSSWTSSFLEFTSDTANSCDIQAVKLAQNKFKFAYSIKGGKCFYSSNTSQVYYTPRQLVNSSPAGEGYGRVRAGYRLAATDSCLSVWSTNTGGGIFSTYGCDSFIGINQNGSTVPTDFAMSQNYPNPFNPVTNIKFSIPQASFVKLVVFDVAGRQVAELVNKQMTAGSYTADFDASHLSSGVYFYRISTDNFTDVKKMMLIK